MALVPAFPLAFRIVALTLAVLSTGADDLAFLHPWFTVESRERDALARRGVVVRALPASERQLSVIAVCAVTATPESLLTSIAGVANPPGAIGGSFGASPGLQDLAALTLDQGDIDRLRQCRPGSCALNLAGEEIAGLQAAIATSEAAVHEAFRRVLLDRLRRYQAGGLAALPDYRDRRDPVQPAQVFSRIVEQIPFLRAHVPAVANYLQRFPSVETAGTQSSLLWSKVTMNSKPVIMLTHRMTFRPQAAATVPGLLVAAKQIYASRYMNGELSLTMMFAGTAGGPNYLVVVSRSDLDELGGMFSGLKRSMFESRIKDEAARALSLLRDRLERVTPR